MSNLNNHHHAPLPERLRPRSLDEVVGQGKLVGRKGLLRDLIGKSAVPSMIFWGPPGVGKTTLARVVALEIKADFRELSAVSGGKKDLEKILKEAVESGRLGVKTLLFVDEIHRWSKSQQDALLPAVERGSVIFIGATTENPSFEVIPALLSRTRLITLERLSQLDLKSLAIRALEDSRRGLGALSLGISESALSLLIESSSGDARSLLLSLEIATGLLPIGEKEIDVETVRRAAERALMVFDKNGEEFYNLISALHKSLRGSDPNAGLYWLARMIEGGADPLYIARRLVRFASEDIGLANSEALVQANAVFEAVRHLGLPECGVHLAHAVVYLAKSKKSNALYRAYEAARADALRTSHLGVPLHLRNASTGLMKELGYGKDYKYNPDFKTPIDQSYWPKDLPERDYLSVD